MPPASATQSSAATAAHAGRDTGSRSALARRLLNSTLFAAGLTSSIAFVQPSPHDALMVVLAAMCVAAKLRFDRKFTPLLLLLIIWLIGGLLSLAPVADNGKNLLYAATSLYLSITALIYAILFADGDLARLEIIRRAYIFAALLAAATGYLAFFHLIPHYQIFLDYGRVSATFKDPNVFGPFLIFPLLLLSLGFVTHGLRFGSIAAATVLLGGLFLSFSRGAWMHFAVSAAVAAVLVIATTSDARGRYRLILISVGLVGAVALLVIALLSFEPVRHMFFVRAHLLQSYDVGAGGRFWLQKQALAQILDHPNGLGPFGFARIFTTQQHDVYMQGFLVYGWLGGAAYATLALVTLAIGLPAALIAAPWQYYLIAAYATFVGEVAEGFVVDTDHWRHFFLLLGLIWGLTAATLNFQRRRRYALARQGEAAMASATA